MLLVFDSAADGFWGSPEAGHERGLFEESKVAIVSGQTAAGGDHRPLPLGDFLCKGALQSAEVGFAVGLEDFCDFSIGSLFDELVGVRELVAQHLRQTTPHARFSRAHQSDEG